MTNIRLKYILLVTLIAAFLSLQWTASHIHLAKHHDHGKGHHQHYTAVNSHQSIDIDLQSNDFSHHTNDLSVVELDHEFNHKKFNQLEKPDTASIATTFPALSKLSASTVTFPDTHSNDTGQLYRSTVRSRAPPHYT